MRFYGKYESLEELIKPVSALYVFLVFYISKVDRNYLIKAIPLRVIIVITGALSLFAFVLSFRQA